MPAAPAFAGRQAHIAVAGRPQAGLCARCRHCMLAVPAALSRRGNRRRFRLAPIAPASAVSLSLLSSCWHYMPAKQHNNFCLWRRCIIQAAFCDTGCASRPPVRTILLGASPTCTLVCLSVWRDLGEDPAVRRLRRVSSAKGLNRAIYLTILNSSPS